MRSSLRLICQRNCHSAVIHFTFRGSDTSQYPRKGFVANRNAAFREVRGECFCVLNPDIRITSDPFPALLDYLRDPEIGLAVSMIRNSAGVVEASARRVPTPWVILKKTLFSRIELDYEFDQDLIHPDRVAGMFMLFRRDIHLRPGGVRRMLFPLRRRCESVRPPNACDLP